MVDCGLRPTNTLFSSNVKRSAVYQNSRIPQISIRLSASASPADERSRPTRTNRQETLEASTSGQVRVNDTNTIASVELRVARHCVALLARSQAPQALKVLQEYVMFQGTLMEEEQASEELCKALVARTSTDNALEALQFISPTPRVFQTCVLGFAYNSKYRGVQRLEQRAIAADLLTGKKSASYWMALVRAYGYLNRIDDARRVFKAAKKAGAWEPTETYPANGLLNSLVSDIKLAFIRARQFIDEGVQPDTSTFNILLKACMRAKDAKRAKLAWEWMTEMKIPPDAITFVSYIKALSYGGDFEGALAVQDLMTAHNFTPTQGIWGSLLVACGAAQQFETALVLWRSLKQQKLLNTADTYNAMMICCNNCSQGERALIVLSEMKSARVPPTVTTYNLAIKACESGPGRRPRQEQLWSALGLLSEMQLDAGLKPDAVTFGTLMELCAEAKQGKIAKQLFVQMEQLHIPANKVVLTSLIKALGRAGMVDDCIDAFQKMVWGPARNKPNRETFRTVISVLRENGALSQALRVYEGMRKARHAPSNKEFQELIAVAAETALAQADPDLQQQVASLCNVSSLEELDLHGMSTYEARAAVLCVLGMLLSQYQAGQPPSHGLVVITGRGEHSQVQGEPVLKGIVLRLLQSELNMPVQVTREESGKEPSSTDSSNADEDIDADKERAALGVGSVGASGGNPGRLVVTQPDLVAWLQQRSSTKSGK